MPAPAFWHRDDWPARALAPLGAVVDRVATARRGCGDDAGVPVICIGNVTVGGAGKTPVALDVGARLRDAGWGVHYLTRGYGGRSGATPCRVAPARHGAADVGDEALLLARVAPTWVAPDRVAGARAAIADGAEMLVLDDGFQSARLRADLNVLVIDGAVGFGNRHVVPAGPLRELPERALGRADLVVRLGPDAAGVDRDVPRATPLLTATMEVAGATHWLEGARVVAFAGIGRPAKLFDTLAAAGAVVVDRVAFPDHHRYTTKEVRALAARAERAGARLATTAKDHVRLPHAVRDRVTPIDVRLAWHAPAALSAVLGDLTRHGDG